MAGDPPNERMLGPQLSDPPPGLHPWQARARAEIESAFQGAHRDSLILAELVQGIAVPDDPLEVSAAH